MRHAQKHRRRQREREVYPLKGQNVDPSGKAHTHATLQEGAR